MNTRNFIIFVKGCHGVSLLVVLVHSCQVLIALIIHFVFSDLSLCSCELTLYANDYEDVVNIV